MEQHSQAEGSPQPSSSAVEAQLREMYGRVAYTHKTHEKMADSYIARYKFIKNTEIALSALATSSLVLAVFGDSRTGTIVGALLSAVLLGFTLYFKEASLGEQAQKHAATAARLWGVRERLLSLLVDMKDGAASEVVGKERDRINALLEDIYKAAPRTNGRAYAAAQKALKTNEELYFREAELNRLLPRRLGAQSQEAGK
jgi:SMODS and SLOG-associating 2TM effector domain family 4